MGMWIEHDRWQEAMPPDNLDEFEVVVLCLYGLLGKIWPQGSGKGRLDPRPGAVSVRQTHKYFIVLTFRFRE
jgi:hypothetical protein